MSFLCGAHTSIQLELEYRKSQVAFWQSEMAMNHSMALRYKLHNFYRPQNLQLMQDIATYCREARQLEQWSQALKLVASKVQIDTREPDVEPEPKRWTVMRWTLTIKRISIDMWKTIGKMKRLCAWLMQSFFQMRLYRAWFDISCLNRIFWKWSDSLLHSWTSFENEAARRWIHERVLKMKRLAAGFMNVLFYMHWE